MDLKAIRNLKRTFRRRYRHSKEDDTDQRKHGLNSLEFTRWYVSHEAFVQRQRRRRTGPETVSLLTGHNEEVNGRRASPVKSSSVNRLAPMKASHQPFSLLLGKQTQV